IEPGFIVEGLRDQLPQISRVLPQAVFDETQPGSLRSTIQGMHRAASVVRDRISLDGWRIVNRVYQDFQPPRRRGDVTSSDVLAKTNQAIIDLAALNGLATESMTRGQGWRFLDIGRRLERALHTIMLLRDALAIEDEAGAAPLEATLEVADSLITYRSRYLTSMQLAPVLDLLLVDETNPRSIAFQLMALHDHVDNLPRDKNAPLRGREQRLIMSSVHSVRMIDHDALRAATTKDGRSHMDRLLGRLATQLPALSDAIVHKYLIHAGPTQQLTEIRASGGHLDL
ncbi:MAG TPA: alpha-E domain-containing protein, partial [Pirellulales bacterium]